jgi:flagellar biosynthesis protein FlhF
MDVRTYRARTIQDALRLIREDLGPDAAVLHTREVNGGVLGGMFGGRQIEVTASTEVQVPSRLPQLPAMPSGSLAISRREIVDPPETHAAPHNEYRSRLRESLYDPGPSLIDELSRTQRPRRLAAKLELSELVAAGMPESVARELLAGAIKRKRNQTRS